MTDLEQIISILDRAKQPHFRYTEIGEGGSFTVLVLDDHRDGGREVALMYFDLDTKMFVEAGTRWLDP
jgi:hypothetical protein